VDETAGMAFLLVHGAGTGANFVRRAVRKR
jgi:hypothetical protein